VVVAVAAILQSLLQKILFEKTLRRPESAVTRPGKPGLVTFFSSR
jgi:hypothetical protein